MSAALRDQRTSNFLRSALLILAIGAVMVLVGWLLGGPSGVALSALLVLILAVFSSPPSAERMLRSRGARPLSAPGLEEAIATLARRAGLPAAPRLFLLPVRQPQALAADGAGRPVIGLSPSLLQILTPREVVAVAAHEISHLRSRDLGWMRLADIIRAVTRTASSFGVLLVFFNLPLMLFTGANVPWLGVLLLVTAPWVVHWLTLALSRAREHDADAGAVSLTGDPAALASALTKIERMSRPWWWPFFRFEVKERWQSHPSTEARVRRLMSLGETPIAPRRSHDGARVVTPEWRRVGTRPRGL